MKIRYLFFLLSSAYMIGCTDKNPAVRITPRDTTITITNAVSKLFLDSSKLEKFISTHSLEDSAIVEIRNFYNSRNYQFAWFTEDGLAEQTRSFWNLHDTYIGYSRDSSLGDKQLHERMKQFLEADTLTNFGIDEIIETEVQLTGHFFRYAQLAYAGKVDPAELQWLIPRKKIDPIALLDSLIVNKGEKIEQWEPVNRLYRSMKVELLRYDTIDQHAFLAIEPVSKKTFRLGDSSGVVREVKKRLQMLGDYKSDDTTSIFTKECSAAVTQSQKRFGIVADGLINAALINELNVPDKKRIEQMLINMERMRWMPKEPQGNRIVVNIPDFKLHVFENSTKVLDFDIVVGSAVNKTVIFNDLLKYVVFSPYWNVPESIVRKEIMPAMRRNAGYLQRTNMEQTGTRNGLPVIRQKPGGNNSLGKVKFIFPNEFNIYFHDTPAKHLFQENSRAFSHGCIRVSNPQALAEYLLRDRPEWPADSIKVAMNAAKEKWVTLKQPLPVVITYLTCWVGNDGLLNFRKDIYGHDKKMAERLFSSNTNP